MSPFRRELALHVGIFEEDRPWWMFPECALFLLFFARHLFSRHLPQGLSRALLLWLLVAFTLLSAEAVYIRKYHSHWLLVVFPLVWLACADSFLWLFSFLAPRWRTVLAAACAALWLFTHARQSLALERWLAESGGRGAHLSSLATKYEVLDRIARHDGAPRIFLVVNPYLDEHWYTELEAWNFLVRLRRVESWGKREGPGSYFYIFAEGSPGADPDLFAEWRKSTGAPVDTVGPVSVLISPRKIEAGGVEVR